MGKPELDNLVKIGTLKAEAASRKEFEGMLASARRGLADAQNESIETDSQFDLAYGATHRFALAALRHQGCRSENRITVFQTLVHTLGTGNANIQIFLRPAYPAALAGYVRDSPEPNKPKHSAADAMCCRSDCSTHS
jgi:hypothetical protein